MGNTDVVINPNAETGAQSQGRTMRVEANQRQSRARAQIRDRLSVLRRA